MGSSHAEDDAGAPTGSAVSVPLHHPISPTRKGGNGNDASFRSSRMCVAKQGVPVLPKPEFHRGRIGSDEWNEAFAGIPESRAARLLPLAMAELIFAVDRLQKQYELGVGRNLNSPNQLDAGGALDLLETDYQDPWADDHDNLLDTSRTVGGSNPQECHVMHLPSCGPDNCLFNPFSCISALLCIKSDAEYHSRSQEVVGCGPCLTDYSKDPNASVEVLLLGQDSPNVLT
eukprot:CAMPEP_0117852844 /NCGR_PEP_ID=MMETSP0949-20121206/23317_1 /TAXON_ID=44440 /ORGANISM="Chattonella subsalsa, Strain CCMP2191" /LENGTH=229 /DNA_ID=CAMNT_0005701091 /DNA_START=285 /DNA_END=975 /DNA_ORIENTATION=-